MKNFEKAFSDFIDGGNYDSFSEHLFKIVRKSFEAGYASAKNKSSAPIKLLNPQNKSS